MWYVILLAVCIGGDQLLKWWVTSHLDVGQSAPLLPGIVRLTRLHNTGAAWSSFSGKTGLLAAVTIVLMAAVVYLVVKKIVRHPLGLTSAMLVLGGGAGNMIDRLCRGYVVDMFDLEFMSYPIFNLADIFVVIGVLLGAVYYLWFYDKYDKPKKEPDHDAELTAATEHAGVRLDAFLSADGALTRSQAARLIAEGRVRVNGKPAAKAPASPAVRRSPWTFPSSARRPCPQDIPWTWSTRTTTSSWSTSPRAWWSIRPRPPGRHPGQRPAPPLRRQPLRHRRRKAPRHRPPHRPRYQRPHHRRQKRRRPPGPQRAAEGPLPLPHLRVPGDRQYEAGQRHRGRPIGRSSADRKKMAVVPTGRRAVTHWEVVARYPGVTHLRCRLETGRTHQIRVHMAYIGHPILGDTVYGAKSRSPASPASASTPPACASSIPAPANRWSSTAPAARIHRHAPKLQNKAQ